MTATGWARLAAGWASVLVFFVFGEAWLADLSSPVRYGGLFLWIFAVTLWSASGVIEHADHLAERLGEPLGTLILTFSIVLIEVILISAVMLGDKAAPTIGRDAMFSVMMIILNGVVGLSLLIGGWRHHEQSYNLQGAAAYLGVMIPLAVIALVLPNLTTSTPDGTLTTVQAIAFSTFTVLLYGVFLAIQTGRHRAFFQDPTSPDAEPSAVTGAHGGVVPASLGEIAQETVLLVLNILPIVLLSKSLTTLIDHGIVVTGAPVALTGMLIAAVVFTPEGGSALKAAYANDLQRAMNLCLGAFVSTIGLTLPAVLTIGLITGQPVLLGLEPSHIALLAVTLILSTLTFSGPRTTILEGAVHLMVFFVYVTLLFSP
ncbi:calcium:proton antiporter [Marinivivus vitaminiproducens]|uniref:calcium:proton antiporter n=1 Tax=Marinivivus vitaminiproducens TaxID=3035935 RepID=UPI0027A05153|nr:hypothetical protein P4R82_08415 [Geminicoccaceae bacterium SCSIO 64248]